ncbi:hypothetical protein L249_1564 [Ophiocordyceps polyrhachis-furcata BCC 54312]|uniref:Uncharacterized protein n=1 Tax=Ophiocordyceps polyrhachis-furcata BCC 54312 TaxID=1330021 RepID=A0A367L402_9HYPO|nr:hypothetical protein L249_1564 [Ophiocordyceps polyrhachis-furcata BCC 54312]
MVLRIHLTKAFLFEVFSSFLEPLSWNHTLGTWKGRKEKPRAPVGREAGLADVCLEITFVGDHSGARDVELTGTRTEVPTRLVQSWGPLVNNHRNPDSITRGPVRGHRGGRHAEPRRENLGPGSRKSSHAGAWPTKVCAARTENIIVMFRHLRKKRRNSALQVPQNVSQHNRMPRGPWGLRGVEAFGIELGQHLSRKFESEEAMTRRADIGGWELIRGSRERWSELHCCIYHTR